ncbi:DMT family transporter [Dolichospermum heterosporum]|uniref:DMT family transporter n=1 Tax=Dolichospermum heterosporum TAC447 TaxID=747523 RepID=A0ABY5LYJ2_9CYAN|nr:DMT family transporter [Dolichospermum heterosporum]UUO15631.1 DMT family transporter [Dolichospermum heterosporum TAC447]
MHQSSGRWRLGLSLSLVTVFLWGVLPLALTVTLQELDVYTVIWFRFLTSFFLLAIYLLFQQQLPTLEQLRATSWQLLVVATIFLAANYFLFMQGLALTAPANAEVIIQLSSVLLSFGGLVIFNERYTLYQWLGVAVLTLGFALFFHAQLVNLITAKGEYLLGSGLIVFGAIAWAIYALSQKQLLQSLSSANIMLIIYGGCALLFTPLAKTNTILTLDTFYFSTLIFCALNTLVAYGAFAESLVHWQASRVGAVLALAPIITLISGWLMSVVTPNIISPENISLVGVTGAFFVVIGSISIALCKPN